MSGSITSVGPSRSPGFLDTGQSDIDTNTETSKTGNANPSATDSGSGSGSSSGTKKGAAGKADVPIAYFAALVAGYFGSVFLL
jgi:hypothetical protein